MTIITRLELDLTKNIAPDRELERWTYRQASGEALGRIDLFGLNLSSQGQSAKPDSLSARNQTETVWRILCQCAGKRPEKAVAQ